MIIQHNIMALNAHRQLGGNTGMVSKNLEKLSSGYKINRAGDDAAGLAISEKMRAQIKGLDRAKLNAQDGISLVQTAEGALTETHSMLTRLVELATESANGTIKDDDRQKVQDEVIALTGEIDRISQATNFNGINLLDGSLGAATATITAGGVTPGVFTAGAALTGVSGVTVTGANAAGNVTLKGTSVTAAADSAGKTGINGMTGGTAGGFATTGANGGVLTGKTMSVVTGAANGATMDADGNVTVTIASASTNTEAAFATAFATAVGTLTGTDAASTAWKTTTYTPVTGGGGTWTDQSAAAPGASLTGATPIAMGGGNAAGTKMEVSIGATVIGDVIVSAADITAKTTKTITAATGESISFKVDGTKAQLEALNAAVAGATTAPVTTAGTSKMTFKENLKAGNTFTVGSGANAKVFEMIKAGGAVKTTGAIGVVVADTGAANKAADIQTTLGNLAAAIAADPASAALVTATVGANGEMTFTNVDANGTTTAPAVKMTGNGLTMQVGDTNDAFNKVTVGVNDMSSDGLGLTGLNLGTQDDAGAALQKIKDAVGIVSSARSNLGALQNRLEHTINNLGVTSENMTAAESRIRDVDMASEMMTFTKNNVLTQAAQAMLAQANQQPQQVLQLLR